MFKTFKVGGMWFVRIGRLQISFCVCSGKPKRSKRLARRYRDDAMYGKGWNDAQRSIAARSAEYNSNHIGLQ